MTIEHQICDACECVAHCLKKGCVPITPEAGAPRTAAAPAYSTKVAAAEWADTVLTDEEISATAARCDSVLGEKMYLWLARAVLGLAGERVAALKSAPATAALTRSESLIFIDFKQATDLLAMFGGEPTEITLQIGEGHSGLGMYASYTDMPEEGAIFLGVSDQEALPETVYTEPVRKVVADQQTEAA